MSHYTPVVACPLESKIVCTCEHKLRDTGVFFQSLGIIYCPPPGCGGLQAIRKPVDKKRPSIEGLFYGR